jgi:hypothetical protein
MGPEGEQERRDRCGNLLSRLLAGSIGKGEKGAFLIFLDASPPAS